MYVYANFKWHSCSNILKVGILHTKFETRVCQLSWIRSVCVYRKNKIYTILCSTVVALKYYEWVYRDTSNIYNISICVRIQ